MKWFRHESAAHADSKLKRLRKRYGADGYALYWYCLELIAGKVSSTNLSFEIEDDCELIGDELSIDSRRVEEIMRWMVTQGLFEESSGRISCLKMAKFMDERYARDDRLKVIIRQQQGKEIPPELPAPSEDSLQTVCRLSPVPDQTRPDKTIQNSNTESRTPVRSTSRKTSLPAGFGISPAVADWAQAKGHTNLDQHLEHFVGYVIASGKTYVDWDQALKNAIRANWARIGASNGNHRSGSGEDRSAAGRARAAVQQYLAQAGATG